MDDRPPARSPGRRAVQRNAPRSLRAPARVAPSGVHTDKGDYKDGFGVIVVLRRGQYRGAHLVFPEWGVSADLQHGDVLFFNSHDWHGVTPFRDLASDAIRISLVFYFREKMVKCGNGAAELENAKRVRGKL